jgi:hypothetical protein
MKAPLLLFSLALPASADLTAAVWGNVAFAPASAATLYNVPAASLDGMPPVTSFSSVRFTGTLMPPATDAALNITAVSEGGVRCWVDDFLLIDTGAAHNDSATERVALQTIPVVGGVPLPFRLEYSRWSSATQQPTLSLYWQGQATPHAIIPASAFTPLSSPAQTAVAALRDRLVAPACPWQTHYRRSAAAHILAPTGLVVLVSLVDILTSQTLSDLFVQRGGSDYLSRAGLHSRNGSDYTQFDVWAWSQLSCNVSMQTTVAASQLQYLAFAEGTDCARLRLVVQPTMFDERVGTPQSGAPGGGFSVALPGFPTVFVLPAGAAPVPLNASVAPVGVPFFALPLPSDGTAVGYCASGAGAAAPPVPCPPLAEMVANVAAARVAAAAASQVYGALRDVYDGIATGVLWNTVLTLQEGVVAIVSRNPNWGSNSEFVADYVLFNWDSYFIATQAAACAQADSDVLMDIGVATLVQITLARTPRGFVPNWKSGPHSSNDRTENQVGALLSLLLAGMLPASTRAWVIDLLVPPLLTWNEWVWSSRMARGGVFVGEPLMILGSDPMPPHDNGDGTFQGAKYESMDNSPAMDAPVAFNDTSHQVMQYDVSPTALYLSDTEALIALAKEAGRGDAVATLQARFNATSAALLSRLWSPLDGAFANRLFNGSFNARLVPPVLYPLLSGVASDAQVETLVTLLASPTGFCVNASHTPGRLSTPSAPTTSLLTRWYSDASRHSVGCVTVACMGALLLYGQATLDGVEASVPLVHAQAGPPPQPGLLPLSIYVSAALANATALATAPPDASFVLVGQQGWCFPPDGSAPPAGAFRPWPLTNVTLWRLEQRAALSLQAGPTADFLTCGTLVCEAAAAKGGYTIVGPGAMCHGFDASGPATLPCITPLPSIVRSDPNFSDQAYWRGRAWAPQTFLVYLGLKRYAARSAAVAAVLADLVAMGQAVMLQEWLQFGHIVENMSGIMGISQDSGNADPFYAWGGSFGLPALLEAGFGRGRG